MGGTDQERFVRLPLATTHYIGVLWIGKVLLFMNFQRLIVTGGSDANGNDLRTTEASPLIQGPLVAHITQFCQKRMKILIC